MIMGAKGKGSWCSISPAIIFPEKGGFRGTKMAKIWCGMWCSMVLNGEVNNRNKNTYWQVVNHQPVAHLLVI